ncbi:hypothetical protein LB467_17780 [Salegentibacter sp. JZCK2]|uniref:BT4734/BF3469 family protein n=1 Tax=Salegentibacter tibetensis TaxID=2873600 RepID=UPI001CC9241D|nr:BT4734/BF3469 family protein [Salegentibacter tibetensis]MBZ9731539.1 hypothetical protein [Salegentibacter tibetensis]
MEVEDVIKLKVSYQNNVWSSINREANLGEIIKIIKHEKLESKISHLRKLIKNDRIDEYNFLKKSLPSVTFCGTFENNRRIENLINYNSILVIDIDKLNSQKVREVNNILKNEKYVFSHWMSPSGKGFKGLIKINTTASLEDTQIESFHKLAFKKLTKYFFDNYLINLDISGSDISRLCFLSSDSNLFFKKDIEPFHCDLEQLELVNTTPNISKKNSSETKINLQKVFNNPLGKNDSRDKSTIIKVIKYLEKNNFSITETYVNWYRVAYAISNTFTYDIGEKFYLKLCRLDAGNHDELGSINLLRYCFQNTRGDITFNTIVYLAKEKGFEIRG